MAYALKVLLIGGSGQLGLELQRQKPSGVQLSAPSSRELNLCHHAQVKQVLHTLRPQLVINAAAFTAVERAEKDSSAAFAVNAAGVGCLAQQLAILDAPLLHVSTDYVFDGNLRRAYREDDAPAPLSVYGQSKLEGERLLAAAQPRHLTLRSGWLFGVHGQNFVKTILRKAQQGQPLAVVADQFGSPTPVAALAAALWQLAAQYQRQGDLPWGIYHLSGASCCSWHALAEAAVQQAFALGLLKDCPEIIPIASSDYPSAARRPPYSVLDSRLLQQRFGIAAPDWRSGLQKMLQALAYSSGRSISGE